MGPEKGKPVLVLVDLLHRNLPTFHGVTLITICAELALVDVSVAIRALVTHVGKYRLDVALRTGHSLVHSPQRIPSLVMVELRYASDRLPSAQGVAVLAGNIQRAVRTATVGIGLRLRPGGRDQDEQQKRDKQVTPHRRSQT